MNDPFANSQLDLACRVGSRDAIIEAIEDGADINHSGSSPLILAIMANDRNTVETLVELGADISCFELTVSNQEGIIDELMKGAPATGDVPEEDPTHPITAAMTQHHFSRRRFGFVSSKASTRFSNSPFRAMPMPADGQSNGGVSASATAMSWRA